jgi:hypothetical protein
MWYSTNMDTYRVVQVQRTGEEFWAVEKIHHDGYVEIGPLFLYEAEAAIEAGRLTTLAYRRAGGIC